VLLKMIEVSTGLPYRQVDSDVDHCNFNCYLFFVHKVVEFQVSEAFSE